jgi:hypothetical protein
MSFLALIGLLSCTSDPPDIQRTFDFALKSEGLWPEGKSHRYLMSFHACDMERLDCNDPWLHQTFIAASDNGYDWGVLRHIAPFESSVPDLIVRDGVLYIYGLPAQKRVALKTGKPLKNVRVQVLDEADKLVMHVDPSAILDDKGRIVLFFLVGAVGVDPATCPPSQPRCEKVFQSATEIEGSQGTRFRLDEGKRASVSIEPHLQFASDPDIFRGPGGYYLQVSRGQSVQAFFSETLVGSYQPMEGLPGGILAKDSGGVSAGHYDAEKGQFWTYVTKHVGNAHGHARKTEIQLLVSADLKTQPKRSDFRRVISGSDFFEGDYLVASPGFFSH